MITDIQKLLQEPFPIDDISWLPGATTKDKDKCLALAYADLRAYQNRLDDIFGMDWEVGYTPWGDKIICHVTIGGITRSSTGEPDAQSNKSEIGGTASEAQAFKRACAMFGLGRYLYNLPQEWVPFDGRAITKDGKKQLDNMYSRFLKSTPLMVDTKTGEILMTAQNGPQRTQPQQSSNHTAQHRTTPQRPAQPVTVKPMEEDANFYPPEEGIPFGHEDNPFNDPAPAPVAAPVMAPGGGGVNPKKLNVLNALGSTFYNKNKSDTAWDKKREELCRSFGVDSSTQLNNAQADTLIAGLEKRIRELILKNEDDWFQDGELPVVIAECTAYGDKEGVMSLDLAKGVGLAKVLQEVKRRKVAA